MLCRIRYFFCIEIGEVAEDYLEGYRHLEQPYIPFESGVKCCDSVEIASTCGSSSGRVGKDTNLIYYQDERY